MKLAYLNKSPHTNINQLISQFAKELIDYKHNICGAIQINSDNGRDKCDMDVQILPLGKKIRISQDRGKFSKGCRLNEAALEEAVGLIEPMITQDKELFIVNKFGKHESMGRGFYPLIGKAYDMNIPILLGVNPLNKVAFLDFSGSLAVSLNPNIHDLWHWFNS